MLDGALPYVDIWDRKPIGLFLLYAVFGSSVGDGILAYQVTATAFAVATAAVLSLMIYRSSSRFVAVCAGVLYLIWINLFQGWGGQSPVFYNLFVAVAAFVTLHVLLDANANYASVCRRGAMAMLLIGCAIQVKVYRCVRGRRTRPYLVVSRQGLSQRLPAAYRSQPGFGSYARSVRH
jgi:hypothetical protein